MPPTKGVGCLGHTGQQPPPFVRLAEALRGGLSVYGWTTQGVVQCHGEHIRAHQAAETESVRFARSSHWFGDMLFHNVVMAGYMKHRGKESLRMGHN